MSNPPASRTAHATLHITATDYASHNLNTRIKSFRKMDQHIELDARVESIQFLRGAASRASQVLPALYMQLGARMPVTPGAPHWQAVQAASTEFSSLLAISLSCRSIFDDSRKRMTGKRFAIISDTELMSVADYWAEGNRKVEDAAKALKLLRELFQRCARPEKILLNAPSLLERRVGLLKYHANRQAAHISLGSFLFDVIDLVHVVAAVAVLGAMIVDFDDPARGNQYFDSVDEAGWQAAKAVFPALPVRRLFHNFDIHQQALLYWRIEELDGLNMLLNQLPAAIGYWDSSNETATDLGSPRA
jgi:hypothetical protein